MYIGISLSVIGFIITFLAFDQPRYLASGQPGPGLLAQLLAVALTLIGIAHLGMAHLGKVRRRENFPGRATLRPGVMLTVSAAAFAVLLRPAGFLVAASVCAFAATLAGRGTGPLAALAYGAAVAAASALLFVGLLGLPLRLWG